MKIAIIGAGALGLALAVNFVKNNKISEVIIWNRGPQKTTSIFIKTTNQLEDCQQARIIFIAIAYQGLEGVLREMSQINFTHDTYFILCTKGIHSDGKFLHQLTIDILQTKNVMLMFGPSFAEEIMSGETTYVNLIFYDLNLATSIINQLSGEYTNLKMIALDDYIGAQICAIMKNIAAIYMGALEGSGAKKNLLAAFFTFFIKEIKGAIIAHDGKIDTMWELCGIGDLFLTCTSFKSRNYSFGYKIGAQEKIDENHYPEGYYALPNFLKLYNKAPLCKILYDVIYLKKNHKLYEFNYLLNSSSISN